MGKTLKINTITLLAHCTDAGPYQVQFTPEAPGATSTLALNRGVNEYGGLHFAAGDTSNDTLEVGETATKWSLKMIGNGPGGGILQENEVEDVLLVLGYQWELSNAARSWRRKEGVEPSGNLTVPRLRNKRIRSALGS